MLTAECTDGAEQGGRGGLRVCVPGYACSHVEMAAVV